MTANELIENIRNYCESNVNEANVKKYSRYFKEGFDSYGLGVDLFNQKLSEFYSDKTITLKLVLEAAPILIQSPKYEETSFAAHLLKHFHKEYTKEIFLELEKWFLIGIRNWAHTDFISGDILSEFLLKNIVELSDFSKWLKAESKFQRRAVPVTLIKYLKKSNNFTELFTFIVPLMTDKEREVHQGTGWFLREAWKLKREETEQFLLKWKNISPRLIFQYATEKMTKDEKLKFKKEK
jgi:3-methyladenine DNA glycosylase AlkD